MQHNDLNYTRKLCQRYIKSKEGQLIFQMMFWSEKSADLILIELVRDEFDGKSELHRPQIWLTSSTYCRKAGPIYFHLPLLSMVERMLKICEAVKVTRGGIFMNQMFKKFFVVCVLISI